MSDIFQRYQQVAYSLPATYLSWDLFGSGLSNLGRQGLPVELPLRDPNPDELLLRVDALGLCFSDTKLIWAGSDHPRIRGRDLQSDPTVPGHEASLTVVKVGSNWRSQYSLGDRFIIQADVFINGEQKAYGYVQRGAMAQYTYVGPWVLSGDAGSYLLPLKSSTGYAEAALVEPWACVEASYHIRDRVLPKSGGKALFVFLSDVDLDFSGVYSVPPSEVYTFGLFSSSHSLFSSAIRNTVVSASLISNLSSKVSGFDDIFIIGDASSDIIESCDSSLSNGGILCFLSSDSDTEALLDIGRVHYHLTRYVGTRGRVVKEAYGVNTREDLANGGKTWMVGAAGPMGQMHVQRALELKNPPRKIFCTDISQDRLDYMYNRLKPLADSRSVDFVCVNVSQPFDLDSQLRDYTHNTGFDDIYIHAPSTSLVEQSSDFLAHNSVFNIFAGLGLGSKSRISRQIFTEKHSRLIGSSGSSMSDIRNTLSKLESGFLSTRMSLAALGGIESAWLGIKGVKENIFPGKTVIFPSLHNLNLTGLSSLSSICPSAANKLENSFIWTNSAEQALFESFLSI